MEYKNRVLKSPSGFKGGSKSKKLILPRKQLFNLVLEGDCELAYGKKRDRYLRVSVQYSIDFEMHIHPLGKVELKRHPVGDNYIKTEISSMLSAAGLKEDQIYSSLLGYAPFLIPERASYYNNKLYKRNKQEEISGFSHIMTDIGTFGHLSMGRPRKTFLHVIQVAVNDFLNGYKKELLAMEREYLVRAMPKWIAAEPDKDQFIPNYGLWNTPFHMLHSILYWKRDTIGNKFTAATWTLAEDLHRAIYVLASGLRIGEPYHCGDLLQLLKDFGKKLERHRTSVSSALAEKLKTCTASLKTCIPFQMALYFDPRHNNKEVCNVDQKNIVVNYLCALHRHMFILEGKEVPENIERERMTSMFGWEMRRDRYGYLMYFYGGEFAREAGDEPETFQSRLCQLENRAVPGPKFKIEDYWTELKRTDPEMAKLANIATSVPVTGKIL